MILKHSERLKSDLNINFPLYYFQTFDNEYKAVSEYLFILTYTTTQHHLRVIKHVQNSLSAKATCLFLFTLLPSVIYLTETTSSNPLIHS